MSPNPGIGQFDFSWDENLNINQISVFDINGKLVLNKIISTGQTQISLDIINQATGIYISGKQLLDKK